MNAEVDPYEVLGIARGATVEQIRTAYRKAALKYHPDNCPGDRSGAYEQFRRITTAYRAVMKYLRPHAAVGADGTCSPAGFALHDVGWVFISAEQARAASPAERLRTRKMTYATRNETSLFFVLWLASLALSIGGTIAAGLLAGSLPGRSITVFFLGLSPLLLYVGLLVTILLIVPLTRRIVYTLLAFRTSRSLPLNRPQDLLS